MTTLNEVRTMILNSTPSDWHVLHPPFDISPFFTSYGSGEEQSLSVDWHQYLAVFQSDLRLRLAWGYGFDRDLYQHADWNKWPDRQVRRIFVHTYWDGAHVDTAAVLSVDGGRCYLPEPDHVAADKGRDLMDFEIVAWTVRSSDVALARLLETITSESISEFDTYMRTANFIEAPDA